MCTTRCGSVCKSLHLCKLKQFVCLIYLAFRTRLPTVSFWETLLLINCVAMINHGFLSWISSWFDVICLVQSFKTNDLNEDCERHEKETENMDCVNGVGNVWLQHTWSAVFNTTTIFSIFKCFHWSANKIWTPEKLCQKWWQWTQLWLCLHFWTNTLYHSWFSKVNRKLHWTNNNNSQKSIKIVPVMDSECWYWWMLNIDRKLTLKSTLFLLLSIHIHPVSFYWKKKEEKENLPVSCHWLRGNHYSSKIYSNNINLSIK